MVSLVTYLLVTVSVESRLLTCSLVLEVELRFIVISYRKRRISSANSVVTYLLTYRRH